MDSRPLCKPLPNPPQREGAPPNRLKHSKNGLPPLGEGWGGALGGLGMVFRSAGEGLLPINCFSTGASRTFLPPTAAFFTVVTAGVMHRMTVGMAVTTRRKTCFPTVGTTGTAKAKPPAVPTAFCVYFSPIPTFPKGKESKPTAQKTARMDSRPLGRVGEGLLSTTPTTTTNISRIFSSSTKITTIFTT